MERQKACTIICERFGKYAAFFESSMVPLWQGVYDSLAARSRVSTGAVVLDVGAGTGEMSLRLGRLVGPYGHVVAIDAQPQMLNIARRKATDAGAQNIEFDLMSMESMKIPSGLFDSVVGNYSLCCCMDYRAALSECLRVLKPGGRLTYNHGGPSDAQQTQVLFAIFEDYKTKSPSKHLQEVREADALQTEAVDRYRQPEVTLAEMRKLGYRDPEATILERRIVYPDPGAFFDQWITFDWEAEAEEISSSSLQRLRREAVEALMPLSEGPGFTATSEMAFFTGKK